MKKLIDNLSSLLVKIDRSKPDNFAGIGVILYSELNGLPISPLKNFNPSFEMPVTSDSEIEKRLLTISEISNDFHDGFHLIDHNFSLTHISLYFAAPIVISPNVEYHFGSRYRAAFYGSFLPQIIACGVISNAHRPVIFQEGNKIDPYERLA